MTAIRDRWEKKFPKFINLLLYQFGEDFSIWGKTIDEITYALLERTSYPQELISEISQMISLMKTGKVNPEKFLEETELYTIPGYEHLSDLEYFEAIRDSLEKNYKILSAENYWEDE